MPLVLLRQFTIANRPHALNLACLWAAVVFFFPTCHAQTLSATPSRVLRDQTAVILATGLRPNQHVTVTADLIDGEGQAWTSSADFDADNDGRLDLSRQPSTGGSYQGVSAFGLVWSMKPKDKHVVQYRSPPRLAPQSIHFELSDGPGKVPLATQVQQDAIADGVRQLVVKGKLHGILFTPSDPGPHPGLLVLGGSEGGLPSRRAAILASHGYAAFALAYFRFEDLPKNLEAIPLEYFSAALKWMTERPEISPEKIAIVGTSRGGELALQLASMFPNVKAVVAYVPANARHRACCGGNVLPYAWTWKGYPLAFVGQTQRGTIEASQAAIRVENSSGPMLLIGGSDDHVWDSSGMVEQIVERLKQHHFSFEVKSLIYSHAGHYAGRPDISPEWHGPLLHPVSGRPTSPGGTPEGNAGSSIDAIPKMLDFLRRNLSLGN